MPISGRKPQFYRVKKFLPKNRVQQERIKIPQPIYRPLRMNRRDVVRRGELKSKPFEGYPVHRRQYPGRTVVGPDVDEMRAIPEAVVKGNLPERIIYLELLKRNYVEGIDFTFQSSKDGGRVELGGIVVDFFLELDRLVIQVDGPTHDTHIRKAKDKEQEGVLASMGFTVLRIKTIIIDDPGQLEAWFRRHIDPGRVSILDPFDTYRDEAGGYG